MLFNPLSSFALISQKSNQRCSFIYIAAFLAAFSTGSDAFSEVVKINVSGSSTVAPLALEIGKRFEKRHPGVHVNVQTGGSSRGIADVRSGLSDIGMASRALVESEKELYEHTIALDGIAIIIHKDNVIEALSDEQVKSIYLGNISNWKDVGGVDKSITVVNKAEGRSTLELFLHHYKLKNSQIKASVVIGDNQQGLKTVAGNPFAIGYVSVGAAEYESTFGAPIKALPLGGVPAKVKEIEKGSFPLARPLNLVTNKPPVGWVKTFIDFSQSNSVGDLIEEFYFVQPSFDKNKGLDSSEKVSVVYEQ